MISCQTFRANLQPDTHDSELLAHVRRCDACLDYAVQVDPDMFFRAMGGEQLVPPGGVDAFVADVMAQVRSRETETALEPRRGAFASVRRLAVAATVAAAVTAGLLVATHQPAPQKPASVVAHAALVTKPVVETYDSKNATIVEMPSEGKGDAQVVMIFDESLPADL